MVNSDCNSFSIFDPGLARPKDKRQTVSESTPNAVIAVRDRGAFTLLNEKVERYQLNLPHHLASFSQKQNGKTRRSIIGISERIRRLPAVMFTSSSEEDDLIKSYAPGTDSYLRKPSEQCANAPRQLRPYLSLLNQVAPTGQPLQ